MHMHAQVLFPSLLFDFDPRLRETDPHLNACHGFRGQYSQQPRSIFPANDIYLFPLKLCPFL